MKQVANAMKRSLEGWQRVQEIVADPETMRLHLPELSAIADNAIHGILQSADELVDGLIQHRGRG